MARKLRIQYEGAIYHVMSCGNGKAAVFHNDVDRRSFVQTLAEACAKTVWQVHAYWLMKTHFHLVGDEEFRQELLAQMKAKRGPEHFGAAVRESEMAKAERVVQKEFKRLGWGEKELSAQRKGNPEKVRLARLLS